MHSITPHKTQQINKIAPLGFKNPLYNNSHIGKNLNGTGNITLSCHNERSYHEKSADIIKSFLRKSIAAQSYGNMFSNGTYFEKLNNSLQKKTGKHSFSSLDHLNKTSASYLENIKQKTKNLNDVEKNLLSKIINSKIILRHQSNADISDKTLNIFSNDKLSKENITSGSNTFSEDKKCLSNHDFVFFALEFSEDESQRPLNTKHTTNDFGSQAYMIDDHYQHGYLTLTDHYDNRVPPAYLHEHKDFISNFSEVRGEVYRQVHGDKGSYDVPIFNTKDMKLAMGLHLINFLRESKDTEFKKFAFNEKLDDKGLDRVINLVFQPEFHVPRIVSTTNFKKVQLREMSIKEAVKASNTKELDAMIKNKNHAYEAIYLAIDNNKKDVVNHLISQWNMNKKDIADIDKSRVGSYDIRYILSESDANIEILKLFLENDLIEPNTPFRKVNNGNTMLDNAINCSNTEMIKVLLQYGAVRGDELTKK